MAQPTYDQRLDILANKDRQIEQLETHIAQLEARVAQLEQLLEKATRSNKRQAAPFSKGLPKEYSGKPGRKGGRRYGKKAHRPLSEQKPDEIIDVPLPGPCPGGAKLQ